MPRYTNDALFERALRVMPGGVSSPVRAFGSVGGRPYFVASADGAWVTDVDGNRYLDYVQSYGAIILGHAHPTVLGVLQEALARGTTYGAPTLGEVRLCEELTRRVPGLEMVRLVSSGTEAGMSAVRLARGATGRDVIVKFAGCYHGHSDSLLAAGVIPKCSVAPPRAMRQPVITSSKISSAPAAEHASRRPSRKPGAGATTPMLAATGSTITAATRSSSSGTTL